MFDDELPKPKTCDFPRNLETMSIEDLTEYIGELESEIERVKVDIEKKKSSQDAAAAFFK